MQFTLLGTGTPILETDRMSAALLLEVDHQHLLFDAGRGVTTQLAKAGKQPRQIDFIFITHHHYDHICGLGDLLLTSWHSGRETPISIYGPPGTDDIVEALLKHVYKRDIDFALLSHDDIVDICDLVQVSIVGSGMACEQKSWRILSKNVDHGMGLGLSVKKWPCLGYRIETQDKVIAISGDAIDCEGLDYLARDADILVQCCFLAEAEITSPYFERLAKHVIASSGQVGKIATRNNVNKLVLTHFRPKSEKMMKALVNDVRKDFNGKLLIGEDLMTFEI